MRTRWVFVAFCLVYLVTMGGHYTSGDGATKVAWAKALLFSGTNDLDPGPGVRYCQFGIGHALLAMPSLLASAAAKRFLGIRCEGAAYTLLFVVNGAVFLWLVARYLAPYYSARRVWATVAVLGLATLWWPYTKLDFSEPLVTTFWFAGFLLVRSGRLFRGMFLAAFAAAIRQDALVLALLLGGWQLWRKRNWRDLGPMLLGALLPLGLILAMNYIRYGTVREMGYANDPFDNPILIGLYGLLLSPGKSMFLFSPPLVAGLLAWGRFRRTAHAGNDAILFLGVFLAQLLFYAKWWAWSADDSWGVRYLIPSIMLMTIPLIELWDRRWLVGGLAAAGVVAQLLGVLFSGLDYVLMVRQEKLTRIGYYGFKSQRPVELDDAWYQPRYSQLAGHWMLVRVLLGCPPEPRSPDAARRLGQGLYEALPPEVWRQHARLDFIWLTRPRAVNSTNVVQPP